MGDKKQTIISSLDIGTSKVICVIAVLDANNNICVKGIGQQHVEVTAKEKLKEYVAQAISFAEKMAGFNIQTLIVSANFDDIKSKMITKKVDYNEGKIKNNDILEIIKDIQKTKLRIDEKIIHAIPLEYKNNNKVIENFTDEKINILTATFSIITTAKNNILFIKECLKHSMLNIEYFITNGYANSLYIVDKQDALIFDIGAKYTNITLLSEGKIIFDSLIKIAGNTLTNDISHVLEISSFKLAENIKNTNINFSLSKDEENNILKIANITNEEEYQLSKQKISYLNDIVKARIEEIIEKSFEMLDKEGLSDVPKNIFLAGGITSIPGIENFFETITGKNTNIIPINDIYTLDINLKEVLSNVSFSVAFGGLKYMKNIINNKKREKKSIFSLLW
ncbi:MAG: rod shape-determining protein [Rickettsiales bacterium]|jgi:cell division protein FtsA|nr:rod shape-determining protein [Rickettsiales bacterium]